MCNRYSDLVGMLSDPKIYTLGKFHSNAADSSGVDTTIISNKRLLENYKTEKTKSDLHFRRFNLVTL